MRPKNGPTIANVAIKDAPEPASDELRASFSGALDIEYVDAKGNRTERYLEAQCLVQRNGKLYLWGYCEMRMAMRGFLVNRIAALNDGETGEVVEHVEISAWLRERSGMDNRRLLNVSR